MTSPITFSGLASGIDTGALITALVNQAKTPMTRLSTQQSTNSTQSKKLSDIKTKLTTLQTAAKALDAKSEALSNKVTSATETVLKAAGAGGASMGTYKVDVTSVASAERTYSNAFSSDTTAGLVGSGSFSIQVGTGDTFGVTIDADDTLTTLANKINALGADVTAGVFHDGSSYRLQVNSKQPGTANAITFVEDPGMLLGLSDAANEKQAATNAVIKIDGLSVTSATNTITGAVPGVTLTVVDKGSSVITVDRDGDGLKAKLDTFVSAYNDVMKTLNTEFTYTGAAKGPESLMGDGTLHSMQATLRGIVQKVMPNGSSKLTTLGSIGVSTTRDGTLSIDTGKFTKAVASDFGGIASLLAGMSDGSGIMSQISSGVDPYASSGGLLRTKIDDLTARNRRIDSQLSSMQLRLDKYQSNLEDKYTALEQTVSGLQSQGNALSSMLR